LVEVQCRVQTLKGALWVKTKRFIDIYRIENKRGGGEYKKDKQERERERERESNTLESSFPYRL